MLYLAAPAHICEINPEASIITKQTMGERAFEIRSRLRSTAELNGRGACALHSDMMMGEWNFVNGQNEITVHV